MCTVYTNSTAVCTALMRDGEGTKVSYSQIEPSISRAFGEEDEEKDPCTYAHIASHGVIAYTSSSFTPTSVVGVLFYMY